MRVILVSYSDTSGGAARATYRIHQALLQHGLESTMWVSDKTTDDRTVSGPGTEWAKATAKARWPIGALLNRRLRTGNSNLHSAAILPSGWARRLNASDADVIHLHWVNREMMSVGDIGRIKKPVIWTFHDMWPFCGAEHYTDDTRWREGYTYQNRPHHESGFDLNRWTWKRKVKAWRRPVQVVTPSNWLASCVRESVLMGRWPVSVIHNPIDTRRWSPVPKALAREILGLRKDCRWLLFGAAGGGRDPRKGMDLLFSALRRQNLCVTDTQLLVFGQSRPKQERDIDFPVHYTGRLHDDQSLRLVFSAADAIVIPSRQDNLPNAGVEAMACGTPIVAFDAGGLSDLVNHEKSGWLATPFDTDDLARGIQWVLENEERLVTLSRNARELAELKFSYPAIAQKYDSLYKESLRI